MTQQYTRNILRVYDKATSDEVQAGVNWYSEANTNCRAIAEANSLHLNTVVGVVSALSPNNKWQRNLKDAANVVQAHKVGGDAPAVCTYGAMRDKAYRILDEQAVELDHVLDLLNGQKIKAFAECILGHDTCVIDGHAYNIAHNHRINLTDQRVSVGKRIFRELQEMYVRAGKRRGLKGYEMQAVTWTVWRRLHDIK